MLSDDEKLLAGIDEAARTLTETAAKLDAEIVKSAGLAQENQRLRDKVANLEAQVTSVKSANAEIPASVVKVAGSLARLVDDLTLHHIATDMAEAKLISRDEVERFKSAMAADPGNGYPRAMLRLIKVASQTVTPSLGRPISRSTKKAAAAEPEPGYASNGDFSFDDMLTSQPG